jgi:UDPglucose--hexose-1-phosphate uridylyltransferase
MDFPHRRLNALTREWVLVSPHRARRPWLGQVEKAAPSGLPAYDPSCYLCPGNERAGGQRNPAYSSTFVFDNDFAALLPAGAAPGDASSDYAPDSPAASTAGHLFRLEPVPGLCRVVCFSPRHDLSLPELSLAEVETVVRTWIAQTLELGERDDIQYVQVFENKGAMMGASNPHPHSQVWATSVLPNEPAKELNAQADYLREHGACLLCDYAAAEAAAGAGRGERLVAGNDHFIAVVPFWAVWPFEILLVSRRHLGALIDLTLTEITGLADILRRVTARYDNLFETSFPYSMGFHQAPTDGQPRPAWHLHAHFYPPLLRSATVRKFMVGFELLAMPQRDVTPEMAAERLRSLSEVHYKSRP